MTARIPGFFPTPIRPSVWNTGGVSSGFITFSCNQKGSEARPETKLPPGQGGRQARGKQMETMLIAGIWFHLFGVIGPGTIESAEFSEPLKRGPGSHRSWTGTVPQLFQEGTRIAAGVQDLPLPSVKGALEMATPSIRCSRVSGDVEDFGVVHPEKYRESALLPLRRYWDGPEVFPAERGSACVGAAEDGLSFYTCFTDSDIFSQATADNQRMWTLGDVAEFFVKPGGERSDYWEIHITPNGFLMDLHIPDRDRFTAGEVTWEEVIAPASGTLRRVWRLEDRWAVEIRIPWKAFGLDSVPSPGAEWSFAVCRYNYNGGLEDPEHSSTANLTTPSFHQWEDYTRLVF